MKKLLALLLAAMLIIPVFAACKENPPTPPKVTPKPVETTDKPAEPTEAPKENRVAFHYGFIDEPPGMDPTVCLGNTQSTMYACLYEGLITLDVKTGEIIPGCAESWTYNDEKTHYVFTLRDGLKWSDGKPLTAHDFEYSWKRVLDPKVASAYSWFVQMFIKNGTAYFNGEVGEDEVGVKATDDKTLEVDLEFPAAYFMQALLQGCWYPVREDVVNADPEKWCYNGETIVSNGPFRMTEYKMGAYMTCTKNEYFWDADSIKIDDIRFSFLGDNNTALSAFQAGDVDGIAGVPDTDLINLMTTDSRLHLYDKLSIGYLRLNTTVEPLNDQRVRRAINIGIDREALLQGVGSLTSVPALGAVPGGMFLDGKDFRETSGDCGLKATAQVEEARKLLADAGYPNGEGIPILRIHCTERQIKSAEILQQMLQTNLGIETKITPVDDKLNFPRIVEGDYDIAYSGWGGDYVHPMTFLNLYTSTAYDNCTRWSTPEFDKLIHQAEVELNEAEALRMMIEAEHMLLDASPIVPLSFGSGVLMMQDYVTNWLVDSSDTLYIARAVITR